MQAAWPKQTPRLNDDGDVVVDRNDGLAMR
jgi:hypothetical protein